MLPLARGRVGTPSLVGPESRIDAVAVSRALASTRRASVAAKWAATAGVDSSPVWRRGAIAGGAGSPGLRSSAVISTGTGCEVDARIAGGSVARRCGGGTTEISRVTRRSPLRSEPAATGMGCETAAAVTSAATWALAARRAAAAAWSRSAVSAVPASTSAADSFIVITSGPTGRSGARTSTTMCSSPSTITLRARPTGEVAGDASAARASVVNRAGGSTP